MVQSQPGPALVMVQAKFILDLLMGLFARPAGLYCAHQRHTRDARRVVRQVILALAAGARFAHQPCGLAWKMLRACYQRAVGNAHPHSRKACAEHAFGAAAPGAAPQRFRTQIINHLHNRYARYRRSRMLGGSPYRWLNRCAEFHVNWIELLRRLHTHCP